MQKKIPFVVFANCKIVMGNQRAAICDLQRGLTHLIPIDLAGILTRFNRKEISDVFENFSQENHEVLDEYFSYLLENEIIFQTTSPELFPDIREEFETASVIQNCILEFDEIEIDKRDYIKMIVSNLVELDCNYIEVRITRQINDLAVIGFLLEQFEESTVLSIRLLISTGAMITERDLVEFCDKYVRLTELVVYGSKSEHTICSKILDTPIHFNTRYLLSPMCCGNISQKFFAVNLEVFNESQLNNTCLNKKIAIGANGDIKNCPSMNESFGSIHNTTLHEAINKPGFTKYWNITKDEIIKCRDCEFRHICTDCRAYTDDPADIYAAPLKCGYNPYTCEWEEWSTNPLKQEAIDYYGMRSIL